MQLQPLADQVLLKRLEVKEVTAGGIIVPGVAQTRPTEAMVVAVGEGRYLDNGTLRSMRVKVGNKVLFGKYAGTEVTIDDVPHILMREDDILAIVVEAPKASSKK